MKATILQLYELGRAVGLKLTETWLADKSRMTEFHLFGFAAFLVLEFIPYFRALNVLLG